MHKALVGDLVLDSGLDTSEICHIIVTYSGLGYEHSHIHIPFAITCQISNCYLIS